MTSPLRTTRSSWAALDGTRLSMGPERGIPLDKLDRALGSGVTKLLWHVPDDRPIDGVRCDYLPSGSLQPLQVIT
jgi:hypothetical protein